jgi:hypothetical protein
LTSPFIPVERHTFVGYEAQDFIAAALQVIDQAARRDVYYERGESRKNFSDAGDHTFFSGRQPQTYP